MVKHALGIVFSLLLLTGLGLAQQVPTYQGPVVDQGGILSDSEERQLEDKIIAYSQQSKNEIGVLIVKSLGNHSLEDYAHDVYNKWGIGQKDKDNGVLLLIALDEKK